MNKVIKELGIMGGAFNPIHSRHLMVAQCAVDQLGIEKVLFVPSGQPPHKKAGMLDKEERFAMVAAAVADNSSFEASRIEIDREGISWTIDTFKLLAAQYGPLVRLNFIIGEDNLAVLKNYDRRAEFLSLCRLVVSPRATSDSALLDRWKLELPEADMVILDCPANEVSSTLIRRWLQEGKDVRYLVHDAVGRILTEKKHYIECALQSDGAAVTEAQAHENNIKKGKLMTSNNNPDNSAKSAKNPIATILKIAAVLDIVWAVIVASFFSTLISVGTDAAGASGAESGLAAVLAWIITFVIALFQGAVVLGIISIAAFMLIVLVAAFKKK